MPDAPPVTMQFFPCSFTGCPSLLTWQRDGVVLADSGRVLRGARHPARSAVRLFSDADGLLAAAEAGATAVIQPGGSIRDDEVIAAADDKGLAMLFTGIRHFRH